jgi:hypothetical protein
VGLLLFASRLAATPKRHGEAAPEEPVQKCTTPPEGNAMSSIKKLELTGDVVATGFSSVTILGGLLMVVASLMLGGEHLQLAPTGAAILALGVYVLVVLVRDMRRRRRPKRRSTFRGQEHLPG